MTKQKVSNKLLQREDLDIANETLVAVLTSDTITKAAERLGIARKTVYDRIQRYDLQKRIDAVPKEALERLRGGTYKAADELVKELDERGVRDRNKAANDILDRVGVGVKNNPQVAVQNIIQNMGVDFIENDPSQTASGPVEDSEG